MPKYSPCECSGAGFCHRYNREMSVDLYKLCKTREDYRKSFDEYLTEEERKRIEQLKIESAEIKSNVESLDLSQEPMLDENKESNDRLANVFVEEMGKVGINEGNIEKHSEGLGDTIEKVLKIIGITPERFEVLPSVGGCGCSERKKFLNKLFPYRNNKKE